MIKTEADYQECLKRLEGDLKVANAQRARLEELNLPTDQIELTMEPIQSFHAQLKEEVEWSERAERVLQALDEELQISVKRRRKKSNLMTAS